jgi:MFS family permease
MVRRNFWINVLDGVLFSAGLAFTSEAAVLPLFVAEVSSSPLPLAALGASALGGRALGQLLGAALGLDPPRSRDAFLALSALPRVATTLLCLAPVVPGPAALWVCLASVGLFFVTLGVNIPVWVDFIAAVVPGDRRGRLMGWRSTLGSGVAVLSTLAASFLLGVPSPFGYLACFALGATCYWLSFACLAATDMSDPIPSPETSAQKKPPRGLAFYRLLGEVARACLPFLIARSTLAGGTLATAFVVVAARDRFGLPAGEANLLALAIVAGPLFTGVFLGRLADRAGSAPVYLVGGLAGAVGAFALVVAPSVPVYLVGLLLLGSMVIVSGVGDMTTAFRVGHGGPGYRRAAVASVNLALLPAGLLGPLLGGALVRAGGPSTAFLVAGLLALAGGCCTAVTAVRLLATPDGLGGPSHAR